MDMEAKKVDNGKCIMCGLDISDNGQGNVEDGLCSGCWYDMMDEQWAFVEAGIEGEYSHEI